MTYEIKRVDKICGSKVMPLVAAAWAELEASGYAVGSAPYDHEGSAFYIEDEWGKPVAFLHWPITSWKQEMWVQLGYVVPECRRKGMYTALWTAAVEEAQKLDMRSIAGGVHWDNIAMRVLAISQGRLPTYVTYRAAILPQAPNDETRAS